MPVPIVRYAFVALLGLGAVMLIVLLMRPFIFSFAGARDDANYSLVGASEVDRGPVLTDVLLEESHDLLGEAEAGDGMVRLRVVAAPLAGRDGYSVVNAWSPVSSCPLTLGADRLVDCDGHAWTYQGFPIDSADPLLQSFPNEVRQGAIVVDFTRPGTP
ncbi:MAG TPA: hypothetical protein VF071_03095 [Candidatus Limnocylindria bacterium]